MRLTRAYYEKSKVGSSYTREMDIAMIALPVRAHSNRWTGWVLVLLYYRVQMAHKEYRDCRRGIPFSTSRWLPLRKQILCQIIQYPEGIYKIPSIDRWHVIVNSTRFVDDLRKASDTQISFAEAVSEFVHDYYTIHPQTNSNPYHADVVRHPLTRNIGAVFGSVQEELETVVPTRIPLTEGRLHRRWVLTDCIVLGCRLDRDPCMADNYGDCCAYC